MNRTFRALAMLASSHVRRARAARKGPERSCTRRIPPGGRAGRSSPERPPSPQREATRYSPCSCSTRRSPRPRDRRRGPRASSMRARRRKREFRPTCATSLARSAGAKGAAGLTFAGPLNTDDEFTELADLDGLVGTARVQASYTSNSTTIGSYDSVSARSASRASRIAIRRARPAVGRSPVVRGRGRRRCRWASAAVHGEVRWEQAYHARTSQTCARLRRSVRPGTQAAQSDRRRAAGTGADGREHLGGVEHRAETPRCGS